MKPTILCVDDESSVLEGLKLNLRRRFEVVTCGSGAEALATLAREPAIAVVLSDMRMPGMDGATLLGKVRAGWPSTVRVLLTGHSDLDSAIAAVNDGQIFRFLTKPCAPPQLLAALEAAAEQHRLVSAERVLLEQTLHGSIKVLVDVLALTSPRSFGRATRIKTLVSELCTAMGMVERWQVEVAAMVSELGSVTLPDELVERLHSGQALSENEQAMVTRSGQVTQQLLANIPRLEAVQAILLGVGRARSAAVVGANPEPSVAEAGIRVLRLATDFDALEAQGHPAANCVDLLRSRGRYDSQALVALTKLRGGPGTRDEVREVTIASLRVGMVFVRDVKLSSGTLLVARGYEVTAGFLERLRNFRADAVAEPLQVVVPAPKPGSGHLAA